MKPIKTLLLAGALSALVISGCQKKKVADPEPAPAPDPYTYNNELQSSKDVTHAAMILADADAIAGQIFENAFVPAFFSASPNQSQASNTISLIQDATAKMTVISFNQVKCRDGKIRDGSIFFNYTASNPNAKNYRDVGFSTSVVFSNYNVDGWRVEPFDPASPAIIRNTVSSTAYDPTVTKLTWEFSGHFRLLHPTDSKQTIIWDGKLTKTLTNSDNASIFNPNKTTAVNWSGANISYSGSISGFTGETVPFTYTIDKANALTRNFTCKVGGNNGASDFHPFISGTPVFKTANFHPRTINYGPALDCDNKGTITFKDEVYQMDFD